MSNTKNSKKSDQSVIYLITCIKNNKQYVGQALCYIADGREWGAHGRWKSHVREAFGSSKDHCVLLNNALRKYKVENFKVETIHTCCLSKIDKLEEEYIKKYNTLVPHGYNLTTGGANGKDSDETRKKKSISRTGLKHAKHVKEKISKNQIGNRRDKKKRKYPEDECLPKYIIAIRNKQKIIIGYRISHFPIGIKTKKYITKSFSNALTPKKALADAIIYLNELKEKYKDISNKPIVPIVEIVQTDPIVPIDIPVPTDPIDPIISIDPLEYISEIYNKSNKKVGYKIEGVLDHEGNPHPMKKFTKAAHIHNNMRAAVNYIRELKVINQNNLFEMPILPKYLIKYSDKSRKGNAIRGFKIHKYPFKNKDGSIKYINKKFSNMGLTMKQKYTDSIIYLNQLKKDIIPIKEKRKTYFRSNKNTV